MAPDAGAKQVRSGRIRRAVVAVTPVAVATVLPAVLVVLLRGRLPARAFTGERSTQYAFTWAGWIGLTTAPILLALTCIVISLIVQRHSPSGQRWTAAAGAVAAAALGGHVIGMIWRVLDRPAPLPIGAGYAVALLAATAVAGVAGWLLAGRTGPPAGSAPAKPGSTEIRWSYLTLSGEVMVAAGTLAGAGAAMIVLGGRLVVIAAWLLIFAGALLLLPALVRTRVTGDGVSIVRPLLRTVVTRADFADIASAQVREVDPAAESLTGGGCPDNGRSYGLVTRGGPALSLRLTNGRELLATVEHAAEAADLINAELELRRIAA